MNATQSIAFHRVHTFICLADIRLMFLCLSQWDQGRVVSRDIENYGPGSNNLDGGIAALRLFYCKPMCVTRRQLSELVKGRIALGS